MTFLSVLNLWNNNNKNNSSFTFGNCCYFLGDAASIKLLLWDKSKVNQISSLTKFLLAIKFDDLSHTFSPFSQLTLLHIIWCSMTNDVCCWINLLTHSYCLWHLIRSSCWSFPHKNLSVFYEFYFHVYVVDKNETFEPNRFSTKCHFSHVNWHKQRWKWQ